MESVRSILLGFLFLSLFITVGCDSYEDAEYASLAYVNNNPNYCEKISDSEYRTYCLAVVTSDFDKCLEIDDNADFMYGGGVIGDCLAMAAYMYGKDESKLLWCDKISEKTTKIRCRAILLDDPYICEENDDANPIDKETNIGFCISFLAESSGNIDVCNNYNFSRLETYGDEEKDSCLLKIFQSTGNKQVCDQITHEPQKSMCGINLFA